LISHEAHALISWRTMKTPRKYEMNAPLPHSRPPVPCSGFTAATEVHSIIMMSGMVVLKTHTNISAR
jgi:hypothetical protein